MYLSIMAISLGHIIIYVSIGTNPKIFIKIRFWHNDMTRFFKYFTCRNLKILPTYIVLIPTKSTK